MHLDEGEMQGGVGKKIARQIRLWREMGHFARVFILSPDNFKFDGEISYPFNASKKSFSFVHLLYREFSRSRILLSVLRDVAAYAPDIIYLRYGLYTYRLEQLFNIAPVVVEINTNDIDEYRYRGLFFYWFNKLTRGKILRKAAGIVAPSYEIQKLPCNQEYRRPIIVVTNGIDLNLITSLPPTKNETPVLAFVATPGYPWHGFDKLYKLAELCPDIYFMVIGYGPDDWAKRPPENMELFGFLNPEEIQKKLLKADAAFGTLALHRKNMEEACPLKVREALAYGFPIIYAYKDTDLEGVDSEFLLRLPNTENNVEDNVGAIREFAYRMRGRRIDRGLISSRIDQRTKEKKRLEFFEEIIRSSNSQRIK